MLKAPGRREGHTATDIHHLYPPLNSSQQKETASDQTPGRGGRHALPDTQLCFGNLPVFQRILYPAYQQRELEEANNFPPTACRAGEKTQRQQGKARVLSVVGSTLCKRKPHRFARRGCMGAGLWGGVNQAFGGTANEERTYDNQKPPHGLWDNLTLFPTSTSTP